MAFLPTATVLIVFFLVEVFSRQQLLIASLASSAFLIYLDPRHTMNSVRTVVFAQAIGAVTGFLSNILVAPGYGAAAVSMVMVITLMVLADSMHPPAVSTALSFSFRSGPVSNLVLFGCAVGLVVVLVLLQRASVWLIAHSGRVQGDRPTDFSSGG